jgi:hypothetical protein
MFDPSAATRSTRDKRCWETSPQPWAEKTNSQNGDAPEARVLPKLRAYLSASASLRQIEALSIQMTPSTTHALS